MGILIATIAIAAAQIAGEAAPATSEHRLTPEQIEAVLADVAAKREAAEKRAVTIAEIPELEPLRPPQIHGEFGIGMGTGGYREIFGTGIYPMGTDGVAAVSFDFVDFGNRSYRRNRY
jgi:hypothetical protein